ncbi:MAG: hypothetical protein ACN6I4_00355 [bacterium]
MKPLKKNDIVEENTSTPTKLDSTPPPSIPKREEPSEAAKEIKPAYDTNKIPSLKDFSKKPENSSSEYENSNEVNQVAEPEPVYGNTETISFDNAWQQYTDDLKDSGKKILISLFEKIQPNYDGKSSFSLEVPNTVVADRLEDEKQDMLIFLRRKTGNNQLNLVVEVLQQETEIAPYTNKEKFESLAKKNPKLINLKNDLDLEIE